MADNSETTHISFESLRVPLGCSIDLRFEGFSSFAGMHAADISMGGMFIRTAEMQPPGTVFEFNFELADGQSLIRGTAEVVWCRPKSQGRHRPSGLGVRFLDLPLESKLVIYRLVDDFIQRGGTPFELESEATGMTPQPAGDRRRAVRWALAVLAAVAVGGALGLWLPLQRGEPNREARDGEPGAGLATAAGKASGAPLAAHRLPESPVTKVESPSAERHLPTANWASGRADQVTAVEAVIDAWKQAWSARDVDRYLSFYSEDFRPASELPLSVWRSQRRERLAQPQDIEIEVSALEVDIVAADRAIARFDQAYSSPAYRDRVKKSLELVLRGGEWKVVQEEVVTTSVLE